MVDPAALAVTVVQVAPENVQENLFQTEIVEIAELTDPMAEIMVVVRVLEQVLQAAAAVPVVAVHVAAVPVLVIPVVMAVSVEVAIQEVMLR
jgi:hypothetical protein